MAETIFTLNNGTLRAIMGIRRNNGGTVQTLDKAVPDGDTVGCQPDGTGSVRFLGIDTPEKTFEQPLTGDQMHELLGGLVVPAFDDHAPQVTLAQVGEHLPRLPGAAEADQHELGHLTLERMAADYMSLYEEFAGRRR